MTISKHFSSQLKEEERRFGKILQWISYAGIFMLVAMGSKSIFTGHTHYGLVLYGFALLILFNTLYFGEPGREAQFRFSLIGIAMFLLIYLAATGGESNTGLLWFYIIPPLIFYMTGLQVGLMLIAASLIFVSIIFRFPHLPFVYTEYPLDFQIRFIASMCFVTTFCYILDHSRRRVREQLLNLAAQYEKASKTDELTGLYNRREMINRLEAEMQRYQRYCHHFSIILLDIDHFKTINDTYGHDAGDEVLKKFARLILSHSRQMDVVARWGGEEFLIMLPETTLVQALALAERIRSHIEQETFSYRNAQFEVHMSAGVCSISQAEDLASLLRQADMYLYEAKTKGRNRIIPMVRPAAKTPDHAE